MNTRFQHTTAYIVINACFQIVNNDRLHKNSPKKNGFFLQFMLRYQNNINDSSQRSLPFKKYIPVYMFYSLMVMDIGDVIAFYHAICKKQLPF